MTTPLSIAHDLAALHAMNADLHCHSTVSDGWLEPGEVVRRAKANGVDLPRAKAAIASLRCAEADGQPCGQA